MTEVDPWAEMEEALDLCKENRPPSENYTITHLPDGDIHVCKGSMCPFVELNAEKCYVCSLTGICYGTLSIREDFGTGRQVGSSNPDDHAGEPVGGQWKPKKDMHAMSAAAYNTADGLLEKHVDTDSPGTAAAIAAAAALKKGASLKRGSSLKRGARCVDEPILEAEAQKRPRVARKGGNEREQFVALQADAEVALCKLVNFTEGKAAKTRDARLMDKNVLFKAAFERYTRECLATGVAPTLDTVHNIAIAAANVAAQEKRKAALEDGKTAPILRVRMREQITSLAVCLWQASCATPYMDGARRSCDSFKPFVCGVLYALKRGVSLPDGTVVVPACPQLADALPALRNTVSNSAAKALHASSHRGLCSLHRSIASCDTGLALQLYGDAARLAYNLANSVRSGQFDLC